MNRCDKYDVFISYSRRDYVDENKVVIPNNIVSQIKDALKKADISYWFDEDGLYSGDAWAEKLAERIEECSIFLFISTSNSNKSEWTSKEVATAHMFKKKIIPFRVDESVYNKSVIIYIANLDFIDYFTNPTFALTRLVDSISKYIKDKKEADEKLLAKKRKEEDEAKRLANAEQNALIEEVETACSDIEEYELKSVHTRKKATSKIKKIKSAEQRTRLANLIQSSGQLYVENQNLKEEKSKLSEENTALQEEINTETEKFKTLYIGYKSLEEEKNNLAKVIDKLRASLVEEEKKGNYLKNEVSNLTKEIRTVIAEKDRITRFLTCEFNDTLFALKQSKKRLHYIYGIIIILLVIISLYYFCYRIQMVNNDADTQIDSLTNIIEIKEQEYKKEVLYLQQDIEKDNIINYLDSNLSWDKNILEKCEITKGLWDALNERRFDDILNYERALRESKSFMSLLVDVRKNSHKNFNKYISNNHDTSINIPMYINKLENGRNQEDIKPKIYGANR